MGSGLDDWIYWHFIITINYDSSQSVTVYDSLHSLLDHESLLNRCDEWRTTNHCSHIELSFKTSGEPNRGHHLEEIVVILPL
jgi:hypothetical protein